MTRTSMGIGFLVAVSCLTAARGEEPGAANSPVGWVAVPSLVRIDKEVVDLEIAPGWNTAAAIEMKLPFFGSGGIDPSRPAGYLYYPSSGAGGSGGHGAFVVPVAKDHATVEQLTQMHATPVPDHADMVRLGPGLVMRRTEDALIFGDEPAEAIAAIGELPYLKAFTDPQVVLGGNFDLAAVRKNSPEVWEAFWAGVNGNQRPSHSAAQEYGRVTTIKALRTWIEGMNTIHFELAHRGQELEITTSTIPSKIHPAEHAFPKPQFPEDAMVTAHLVYSDAKASHWFSELMRGLPAKDIRDPNLTDEENAKQREATLKALDACVGADAQSIGVEMVDGTPVVTVVNQYSRDVNLPEEIRSGWSALAPKSTKKPPTFTPLSLADGATGYVLKMSEPQMTVGLIQKGRVATVIISPKEQATYAPAVFSATEQIGDLLNVSVSFDAILRQADQTDDQWLKLPSGQQEHLRALLAHKHAMLEVTAETKPAAALAMKVTLPATLVQAAPILMQIPRQH